MVCEICHANYLLLLTEDQCLIDVIFRILFWPILTWVYVATYRVKFREEESQKKLEEKEKKKEELRQAEEEKECILEAIRQKVLSSVTLLV